MEPWIDGLWDSLEGVLSSAVGGDSTDREVSSQPLEVSTDTSKSDQITGQRMMTDSVGTKTDVCNDDKTVARLLNESKQDQLTTDSVQSSTADQRAITDLTACFQDKLTTQSAGPSNLGSTPATGMSPSSPQSGDLRTAKSTLEATVITSSSNEGDTRLKVVGEDSGVREELKTPALELATTPLTLPSVQPPFIKVLMKTVSMYGYTVYKSL